MAPSPQSIGTIIRARRTRKKLSLRALSDATGFDMAVLSRIETGNRLPHVRHLNAIAKALGCPTRALLP